MKSTSVVIAGSGFAGLCMGIRLKKAGIHDFILFEQADRVGGTWRDNHYPGAACDVESHLYSFSFEPNPRWTRQFAPQAEILSYLEACADKYGLRPHIRLNTAVRGAVFDENEKHWFVETSDGKTTKARALVAACGGLSKPAFPDIRGLDAFRGKLFHSARWDDKADLKGKRVAVIGTGASAIQIVPSIAPEVSRMHVFQRTPPWILPKRDFDIDKGMRELFARLPFVQQLARARQYLWHELWALGFIREPRIMQLVERLAKLYLAKTVPDPLLREKLTPQYTLGCKRVLLSNDYYPAMSRPNVELVTERIEEVREQGAFTKDGVLREVDAIILATGFQAAEAAAPFEIRGRGGRDLNDAWRDGPEAYLGTTIAGFPNFFLIVGPNVGLGHSSMVYMIESQVAYVMSTLEAMRERNLALVDVRPEAQEAFNRELQARFPRTVWSSGCVSWYQTRNGKNTTLWPGFTFEYRFRTRRFDPGPYEVIAAESPSPAIRMNSVETGPSGAGA